ncbi:MAG: sigma-E processing peptidase SpoIIGA [Coprococcus sp.]
MQYEVYLDVLFLENMMMDFLILLAVKKVFPCSATYGSLLAGSFTGSLLTCAILFFPCPVWTRYIPRLLFLVSFLYDSDRIENPDISPRFFKACGFCSILQAFFWRYHELAPSLFWKIFPDHIFSFHPWHLWFFSFISWTFVSKETMEITRS